MTDTGPAEGFVGVPTERDRWPGGEQYKYRFDNGYGASVIRNGTSYGGESGLWELAVLGPDGHLTYETPITSDVEGYLGPDAVARLLGDIQALPAAQFAASHTGDTDGIS